MEQYKFRIMIEAGKGELSLRKMPKSSKKKCSCYYDTISQWIILYPLTNHKVE